MHPFSGSGCFRILGKELMLEPHPHCGRFLINSPTKVVFGSPTPQLDPIPLPETFQAGGNATIVTSSLVSRVHLDPTGLGRWNGVTLRGSDSGLTTITTGYRVCAGSKKSSSLSSAYAREHDFFRSAINSSSHPRRAFLNDLKAVITDLQSKEHSIMLMLDANATLESDRTLDDFFRKAPYTICMNLILHPRLM
jgi:hypothetical protein